MRRSPAWMLALGAATVLVAAVPARADTWGISVYGGWNGSLNSDAHFTGPSTDWTVHSIPWDGLSFGQSGGPPYYGVRLSMWPTAMPGWGIAVDFTHAKARAVRDATVSYTGAISGGLPPGS